MTQGYGIKTNKTLERNHNCKHRPDLKSPTDNWKMRSLGASGGRIGNSWHNKQEVAHVYQVRSPYLFSRSRNVLVNGFSYRQSTSEFSGARSGSLYCKNNDQHFE